jgi:predicted  nucleic acid-binding Zn-ribbon protein
LPRRILEINQSKKYAGRTNIKWVLLEIHESNKQFNKNGITWLENHIQNNLESTKGMPIAAQFLDSWDKDEPFGHGFTNIKDGEPLFEDSVVVGSTERGYIDTVEIDGAMKKVLIAEGYLYHQRYPNFIQWLKAQMFDDKKPDTSVEICPSEGFDEIVYEGGWREEGRIPQTFDFSGSAILGIAPADNSAILLELNQKGDLTMGNETIVELNQKLEARLTELNEAKQKLEASQTEVNNLTVELNKKKEELDATVEENKEKDKELEDAKKEKEDADTELNELRDFKASIENEQLKSELNSKLAKYTDEEKKAVESKVNEFNQAPSKEKIGEIVSEINSAIAQAFLAQRDKQTKTEVNSADIYSPIVETNSDDDVSVEDLY